MEKEHVKGTAKDVAGKVQQKVGELTGSEKQQVKGMKKQVEGKVDKAVGDVKDAFEEANKPKPRTVNRPKEIAMKKKLENLRTRTQSGAIGWILLWALGIPIPILLVLFLLRGCT